MIEYKLAKKCVLGMVMLVAAACNSTDNKTEGKADTLSSAAVDTSAETGVEFEKPVEQQIYADYTTLKNALVASKKEEAAKAAGALSSSLRNREGCENTALVAERIASAKDLAAQRKDFTAVSTDLIALFKHAPLKKGEVFVQHCPMANNGEGGDWLASERKVLNPYYGDEMLECGAVVEEIKAGKSL